MISFFRLVDRIVGAILIIPLWLFSLPFPKAKLEPRRILVIKLWAMGESILTLPLIRAVKKRYPSARIDVLCRDRVKAIFSGNKDIADIKSAEFFPLLALIPRLRSYDIVFDCEPYLNESALLAWWLGRRRIGFAHNLRNMLYTDPIAYDDQKHVTRVYVDMAQPLGITGTPERLIPIATSRADEKKIDVLCKEWGVKKGDMILCIAPGAAESARGRIWSPKRFAKVADKLVSEFLVKVIIVGSKGERWLAEDIIKQMKYNAINAAGETSVKELAALLKRCTLMIGNDSGPMHLSAAMGARTIGLFCPNTPVRFAPYGPGNDFVYTPVLEKPCINVHKGQVPDCSDHQHMTKITSEDVLQKARKVLYAGPH